MVCQCNQVYEIPWQYKKIYIQSYEIWGTLSDDKTMALHQSVVRFRSHKCIHSDLNPSINSYNLSVPNDCYGNFYTHFCGAQRCRWKHVYCYLTAMWCWLLCFPDCRNIIVISDLSSNLYPHCNLGSVSIGCVHEYCMLTCSQRHCQDQPDYHIIWKNRHLIVCYDCHSKDANFKR